MLTLLFISLFFSIVFIFLNHPLSMGCILLIQTILTALISGHFYYNYWFSYMLFLIMIGGMMVMFIYMTSIASNEKFSLPKKYMLMFSVLSLFIIILSLLIDPWYSNLNMMPFSSINQSFIDFNNFSLNKFFNWPNLKLTIIIMLYLLITLIAAVKIVGKKMGPLRQK
uniref:NADH-ubiquinone oxidoreductase chain 6 n=1 Tax=Alcidodes juglans TaxID=2530216 RepID=A0A482DSX1_9CUCU|nr:NADH dehydrogenase subunit 6 [Alcidodes juglans]QBM10388.1 NADH dehydrogenase subunit 6 [Alcidodes juglans]